MYLPSKSNKQKNLFLNLFLSASWRSMTKTAESGSASGSGSESGFLSQRHGSADPDPDPDPHQNVMDPQHCNLVYERKPSTFTFPSIPNHCTAMYCIFRLRIFRDVEAKNYSFLTLVGTLISGSKLRKKSQNVKKATIFHFARILSSVNVNISCILEVLLGQKKFCYRIAQVRKMML